MMRLANKIMYHYRPLVNPVLSVVILIMFSSSCRLGAPELNSSFTFTPTNRLQCRQIGNETQFPNLRIQWNPAFDSEVQGIFRDILNLSGLGLDIHIRRGNVPTAKAVICDLSGNEERYIIYNPQYVSAVNKISGSRWGAYIIMAHEIGHHLRGHTLQQTESKPTTELEADQFAGFILYKLNVTLIEIRNIVPRIMKDVSSDNYPRRTERLAAIEQGWKNARGQVRSEPARLTDIFRMFFVLQKKRHLVAKKVSMLLGGLINANHHDYGNACTDLFPRLLRHFGVRSPYQKLIVIRDVDAQVIDDKSLSSLISEGNMALVIVPPENVKIDNTHGIQAIFEAVKSCTDVRASCPKDSDDDYILDYFFQNGKVL